MRRFFFAILLLSLLARLPLSTAHAEASWENFRLYFEKCGNAKRRGPACIAEIEALLGGMAIWGDTNTNYELGRQEWAGTKLELAFGARPGEAGDFELVEKDGALTPRIALARGADAYDTLITLNHEIVHFANSKRLKSLVGDSTKVQGCITGYRLALLENEKLAYLSEIYFWKSAPTWFKNEQKRVHFNSRLLGRDKMTYADYYKRLESELERDGNFIARRFIALGKYPKCALTLLGSGAADR